MKECKKKTGAKIIIAIIISMGLLTIGGDLIVKNIKNTGFGQEDSSQDVSLRNDDENIQQNVTFRQISQEQAKDMMDNTTGYQIVDVRTKEEYDTGHIEGAMLIPVESIGSEDVAQLTDKDQVILVYCRSGNRSVQAAKKLVELGYTNVHEFGGVNTWKYGLVK